MRRGFSSHPDRVRGQLEALDRRRREAPRLAFDLSCDLARDELGRCLAEGLTRWREIAPRLRGLLVDGRGGTS